MYALYMVEYILNVCTIIWKDILYNVCVHAHTMYGPSDIYSTFTFSRQSYPGRVTVSTGKYTEASRVNCLAQGLSLILAVFQMELQFKQYHLLTENMPPKT